MSALPPTAHDPSRATAAMRTILDRCANGELPPNVALMQLIASARSPAEVAAAIGFPVPRAAFPEAGDRLHRLAALWQETPGAWETVKEAFAAAADPTPTDDVGTGRHARLFDRLAVGEPDAGAALYTLGRSDLLEAATGSIVLALDRWGLLGAERDVLDVGCGPGRIALALAPRVRAVTGIDVSTGMLGRARERRRGVENVSFHYTSGTDLAGFGDASFDLVLAVDAFPYMVEAGGDLARVQILEAARVLAPGGSLVIFNFSYAHSLDEQQEIVGRLARSAGLAVVRSGTRDLDWWDGTTFHLERRRQTTE